MLGIVWMNRLSTVDDVDTIGIAVIVGSLIGADCSSTRFLTARYDVLHSVLTSVGDQRPERLTIFGNFVMYGKI